MNLGDASLAKPRFDRLQTGGGDPGIAGVASPIREGAIGSRRNKGRARIKAPKNATAQPRKASSLPLLARSISPENSLKRCAFIICIKHLHETRPADRAETSISAYAGTSNNA
jgi:hypothetical protein